MSEIDSKSKDDKKETGSGPSKEEADEEEKNDKKKKKSAAVEEEDEADIEEHEGIKLDSEEIGKFNTIIEECEDEMPLFALLDNDEYLVTTTDNILNDYKTGSAMLIHTQENERKHPSNTLSNVIT